MSPGNLENLREAAACLKELARVAEEHGATERAAALRLIADAYEVELAALDDATAEDGRE